MLLHPAWELYAQPVYVHLQVLSPIYTREVFQGGLSFDRSCGQLPLSKLSIFICIDSKPLTFLTCIKIQLMIDFSGMESFQVL